MSHLKNNYIFGILSQGRWSDILLNKIQALLIFDLLITLWGHFKASYFKMLNDARVASACLYVRTGQRVRNSKNIATIRDFQVYICVNSTIMCTKYRKLNISKHYFGLTEAFFLFQKPWNRFQNLFWIFSQRLEIITDVDLRHLPFYCTPLPDMGPPPTYPNGERVIYLINHCLCMCIN